jgi:hypothetical protein
VGRKLNFLQVVSPQLLRIVDIFRSTTDIDPATNKHLHIAGIGEEIKARASCEPAITRDR